MVAITNQRPQIRRVRTLLWLLLWVLVLGAVVVNQQRLVDWWKLRDYTPSSQIIRVADVAQFTDKAEHLFFVNKPEVLSGQSFTRECPISAEKTVVLGCYKGGDNGIFLYEVSDVRLQGVVEVTAAHEMLHAAYERLSSKERNRVDGLLNQYFATGLQDDRLKKTIELYRETEPTELANEMHSIFATEVRDLPAELEAYYGRYFTDRKALVTLTENYQAEFTDRRSQVAAYDTQLADIKRTIEALQVQLADEKRTLESKQTEMQSLRQSGNTVAYNAMVPSYNALVSGYNARIESLRSQIASYNDTVEKRNALALEERQLTQALSAEQLPAAK